MPIHNVTRFTTNDDNRVLTQHAVAIIAQHEANRGAMCVRTTLDERLPSG